MLVTDTLLSKFVKNLFTYVEGYKVHVSLYLITVTIVNKKSSLKAKLMETNFI